MDYKVGKILKFDNYAGIIVDDKNEYLFLDTDLEELNMLHRNKLIDDLEYKQAIKQHGNLLEQAINTLGTSNFEFYSNAYNGKNTDFTLVKMSDKQRAELIQ